MDAHAWAGVLHRSGLLHITVERPSRRGGASPESEPVGQVYRWRNTLAIAPLGPSGEVELIDVQTPHIGGIVQAFRLESGRLVEVDSLEGYSTHAIGSRNLEMGVVGDLDGDAGLEILVPTQSRDVLAAIRHEAEGLRQVWQLELGARLTTNVGAVATARGGIAIAVGTGDNALMIWGP